MYIMLKKITKKLNLYVDHNHFMERPCILQVTSIDIFDIFKKFKNNSIQISQNNIYTKYDSIKRLD